MPETEHVRIRVVTQPEKVFIKTLCISSLEERTSLMKQALALKLNFLTYEEGVPGTLISVLSDHVHFDSQNKVPVLVKQFNSSLLRVREGDGQLTFGDASLDRERLWGQAPQCVLAFNVVSLSQEQFRLVHVEVEVRDVNDHAPHFPLAQIPVEVSEGAAVGTRIPLEVPVDEDVGANGLQTMRLNGPNSPFRVELQTRADGAQPYTVRVGDENDNAPLFTRPVYEVSVRENNPPGAYLATVAAREPDLGCNGHVTYRLPEADVGRSGDGCFTYVSAHSVTGELRDRRSFELEELAGLQPGLEALDGCGAAVNVVRDRDWPTLTCASTLLLVPTGSVPPGGKVVLVPPPWPPPQEPGKRPEVKSTEQEAERQQPDLSVVWVCVLASSCALLLVAIVIVTCFCKGKART
ncbi:Protocadherin-8 [Fukomys damarensis]|uniref:Protocadherin-8 n=1 Tax=Fukomys damarensis TaxID=885580 RepID=A0A091D702_FUKDA|nr:Protocadherin-8 [Fukomys damarensis]